MTAEEIKNPPKSIPISFYAGLLTIITLSFGIIFFSVSSVYWPSLRGIDYPLIFILEKLQRGDVVLLAVFSFFSLSSFIASINGMMIGYSRQIFSLSRAGYLPKFMDKIMNKSKIPFMALVAPSFIVLLIAEMGNTALMIQVVCVCAITSYSFSLSAFIKIMQSERSRFRKVLPAYIALLACAVFLIGFLIFQTVSTLITFGILAAGILYYYLFSIGRINSDAPEEIEANLDDFNIIITNI
jgi:ethanolamine permease